MPEKVKTNNQYLSGKVFNETKKEFIGRFDDVYKVFNETKTEFTKKFDDVYCKIDDVYNEIKDDIKRLTITILQTNERVNLIEQKMATKDDIKQILTAIDSFAHQTIDHERKAIVNTSRIMKLEPQVEDHEKRITALESRLSPKL
ncbi:MAG: hypothetical protein AB1633_04150 [Elusimicrobiota bacterium]